MWQGLAFNLGASPKSRAKRQSLRSRGLSVVGLLQASIPTEAQANANPFSPQHMKHCSLMHTRTQNYWKSRKFHGCICMLGRLRKLHKGQARDWGAGQGRSLTQQPAAHAPDYVIWIGDAWRMVCRSASAVYGPSPERLEI